MRRLDDIGLWLEEKGPRPVIAVAPGLVNHLSWAVERIRQLEAALEAAKRGHVYVADDDHYSCDLAHIETETEGVLQWMGPRDDALRVTRRADECGCGADAHNAAIDAVLNEDA